MADVIRTALDAHRLVLITGSADPTRGNCSTWATCTGCGWTMNVPAAQAMTAHITHQAEVATTAVLEVVRRVLDEHPLTVSYTGPADHLQSLFAAALAGEG